MFAVRSTGCDRQAPGEPRVVAANCAKVTAHVSLSNHFTRRQLARQSAWPPCSVRCDRRSESQVLQRSTTSRPVSDGSKALTSQTDRRELQRGMPALAASAELQSLARRASALPGIRLAVWELPRFPPERLSRIGRSRTQVSHADCGDTRQLRPSRDASRLDFLDTFAQDFAHGRPRSPAIAASKGLAVHSVRSYAALRAAAALMILAMSAGPAPTLINERIIRSTLTEESAASSFAIRD